MDLIPRKVPEHPQDREEPAEVASHSVSKLVESDIFHPGQVGAMVPHTYHTFNLNSFPVELDHGEVSSHPLEWEQPFAPRGHSDTSSAINITAAPVHPYSMNMDPSGSHMIAISPSSAVTLCSRVCSCGVLIPQRPYRPPKSFECPISEEVITFSTGDKCGISVTDALNRNFSGLVGRDDQSFVECGTSISLRFEWPGCEPWTRQIKTQDWSKKRNPINKSKLATEIAKQLERFIKEMDGRNQTDPKWRVGRRYIEVNHLILVSLNRVSKASWQPHFRLVEGYQVLPNSQNPTENIPSSS